MFCTHFNTPNPKSRGATIPATGVATLLLNNINYLIYWAIVSAVCIASALILNYLKVSLVIQRKVFHLMLILIFIPGLQVKVLLWLCFLFALYVFAFVEGLRPHVQVLNDFFLKFIDDRDSQDLIFSHIYLLLGFGFPVFFSHLFENELIAWAGIISLGVGDSVASLVGFYVGTVKLPNRKKTLEGTAAGFLAQCLVFNFYGLLNQGTAIALLLTAAYEACTQKIANLVLPVLTFFLLSYQLA